jgi:hypothetical protein
MVALKFKLFMAGSLGGSLHCNFCGSEDYVQYDLRCIVF